MLLVMILFMLGGNIYMLFCESWHNQQLFQVSLLWGNCLEILLPKGGLLVKQRQH